MMKVVKGEVLKLLNVDIIYPISNSEWGSPVQCVPKKGGGTTVMENEQKQLIDIRMNTRYRMCNDCRKLNEASQKDHFLLPFIDHLLEKLYGHEFYCCLNRYSGYLEVPLVDKDQNKTTFTCPYGIFLHRRMPFELCNTLATFQRCMMDIFFFT